MIPAYDDSINRVASPPVRRLNFNGLLLVRPCDDKCRMAQLTRRGGCGRHTLHMAVDQHRGLDPACFRSDSKGFIYLCAGLQLREALFARGGEDNHRLVDRTGGK